MMSLINEGPPPASPIFVFLKLGDTEGVNLALKTTYAETKRFIL